VPVIAIGNMNPVVAKPVAQMIVSTSWWPPSASSMPVGVMRAIGAVTTSTLRRCSAGRYVELNSTRLQPKVYSGQILRRSSASRSWERMNAVDSAPTARPSRSGWRMAAVSSSRYWVRRARR
jgi:hypothetical protein